MLSDFKFLKFIYGNFLHDKIQESLIGEVIAENFAVASPEI